MRLDMSNENTGGFAFPVATIDGYTQEGMTLRDYFAAKAIQAIEPPTNFVGENQTKTSYKSWARKAYDMADAMLEARKK